MTLNGIILAIIIGWPVFVAAILWASSVNSEERARKVKGADDAYRQGVQAGLKDAAQTAKTIWLTDNGPKVIADALDSMSRSPGYVSAVSNQVETTR